MGLILRGALLLACLGLPLAWGSSLPEEDPFDFPVGTRWSYVGTSGGQKTSVVQEVIAVRQGEFFAPGEGGTLYPLRMRTRCGEAGDEFESDSMRPYLALSGGFLITGNLGGNAVRLYKVSSRKGQSWPCIAPRKSSDPEAEFIHLGIEKVTVPAGDFPNARHIRMRAGPEAAGHATDFWIVPGLGIVKTRAVSLLAGSPREVVLELDSFQRARKP